MKILHYIPTYAPAWKFGGPVRSVSALCEGLVARGHDVTVLTTDAGLQPDDIPSRGQEVLRNGVKVHYYPKVPGYGIKSPQLEQAARDRVGEFDLMHVTAIWQRTGPAAGWAARRARVPYAISPRGALGPYSWRRGRLKKLAYYAIAERRNLKGAAGFHYTSAMEAAECERFRFGKPACIVPNAIDFRFWQRDANAGRVWRDKLGIGQDETVLLHAGRLHHKKGLDLLPAVLDECQAAGLSARLVLVGPEDDDTGARLRAEFARRASLSRVVFLPLAQPGELKAAYSGATVFVMPSLHENFGNAAVEAAACGCWVLVSHEVGVAEELAALRAGESLPREDKAWAAAVLRGRALAGQTIGLRNRLAQAFDVRATAESLAGFYRLLVKGGRQACSGS